jgi:hypothetical protein
MMSLMRYEPRYRPARSLGLLSRLLQDQELDGVLTVSIPKQAWLQARKIDVKSI